MLLGCFALIAALEQMKSRAKLLAMVLLDKENFALSCSASIGVRSRLRSARGGNGVDVFDFLAVLVDDDAAAAVGSWDAVARGAEVEDL